MKSVTKILLAGAIAVAVIALSAAPSEAAKKKKMAAAAPAPCAAATLCKGACDANGACAMNVCGADAKWYPAVFTPVCFGGACPASCP